MQDESFFFFFFLFLNQIDFFNNEIRVKYSRGRKGERN